MDLRWDGWGVAWVGAQWYLLVSFSSEDGWTLVAFQSLSPKDLGFAALQASCLLCLLVVLGVPSCQTQGKGLLKRLFAKDKELEMPRHLLQSLFLPNLCHLPSVRSANELSQSVQVTVIHLSPSLPKLFKCSCRNHDACALLLFQRSYQFLFLLGFCSVSSETFIFPPSLPPSLSLGFPLDLAPRSSLNSFLLIAHIFVHMLPLWRYLHQLPRLAFCFPIPPPFYSHFENDTFHYLHWLVSSLLGYCLLLLEYKLSEDQGLT